VTTIRKEKDQNKRHIKRISKEENEEKRNGKGEWE
jgi:hypothetical protein